MQTLTKYFERFSSQGEGAWDQHLTSCLKSSSKTKGLKIGCVYFCCFWMVLLAPQLWCWHSWRNWVTTFWRSSPLVLAASQRRALAPRVCSLALYQWPTFHRHRPFCGLSGVFKTWTCCCLVKASMCLFTKLLSVVCSDCLFYPDLPCFTVQERFSWGVCVWCRSSTF